MKTYFVITDTHSYYDEMMKALNDNGFSKKDPDHIIIGCGDYMDRGPKSLEMCEFLYNMMKQNRAILIRGNHEDLFEELVRSCWPSDADISNGTAKTLADLHNPSVSEYDLFSMNMNDIRNYNSHWKEVLRNMKNFYETENYVFVHGWIPTKGEKYNPNWRYASIDDWEDARWANGMSLWFDGVREPEKTIVCGHWHTSYGRVRERYGNNWKKLSYSKKALYEFPTEISKDAMRRLFSPFIGDGIIALDACTAHTGFCNCLRLTEEELGKEI